MLIFFNPIILTLGIHSKNRAEKKKSKTKPYAMKILAELSLENSNKEMEAT